MSIKEMEALLEATRKKIVEQEGLIIESRVTGNELSGLVQSINPRLYRQERELEQAVIDAHLDAPVTLQDLLTEYRAPEDTPPLAPAVMKLLKPEEES